MEEKVDDDKTERKNSASITRPARNRIQRKFDDYFVFGMHEPATSSTPIRRSNSQETHHNVESPGTVSGLFSPSTELNLTFDQSSMLDKSGSTSEISHSQTSRQTWTVDSLSNLKYLGKRDISRLDTAVDSPTPVKKKRGRPPKTKYAAKDQSTEVLTQEVFRTPSGEIEEEHLQKRVEEKDQEVDVTHSRVVETDSSFQEEDNYHSLDMEKRQEQTSTNSDPMSDNSQVIAFLKDKAAAPKDKKSDGEKEVSGVGLPKKRGRGRPRKHLMLKSNNLESLHESQVKEGISSCTTDEIHGYGKDTIASELSTSEERVKSERDINEGDSAQEQDSLIHQNSFSGFIVKRGRGRPQKYSPTLSDSNMKRHRGRPKKFSPTQSNGIQMEDFSLGSLDTSQAEARSQTGITKDDPAQEQDSFIHPNSFSDSNVKRGRGRPKGYSPKQFKSSLGSLGTSQAKAKSQRGTSVKRRRGRPKGYSPKQLKNTKDGSLSSLGTSPAEAKSQRGIIQEDQDSHIHPNSFSDSSVKRGRGRPKGYSPKQFKSSLGSLSTSQAEAKSQRGTCVKRRRGRPKGYSPKQSKGLEDHSLDSLDTSQAEAESQRGITQDDLAQNEESLINRNSFSDSSVKKGRGRPKGSSTKQSKDITDPSLGSLSTSQADAKSQRGITQDDVAQDQDSLINLNNFSDSSGKRRRVRPKKYSPTQYNDTLSTSQGEDSFQCPKDVLQSLEDGVPRKIKDGNVQESSLHSVRERNDSLIDDNSQKRKLAKEKSTWSETSSCSSTESDDWKVSSSRGRGRSRPSRGRGRGGHSRSKSAKTPPDDIKCSHCEALLKLKDYKIHLISHHSLVYKPENPEGVNDPYFIVRKQGYVACQQCTRHFKNPQYYGHHIIWCGREDEMFVCSVCRRETKVMWKTQHMRMHEKQELMKLQAEKRKEEELERREQREKEKLEGEKAGKQKRKAARSALTMLNNLEKVDDEDNDENAAISGDEDSDEDEEVEEETVEEGEMEMSNYKYKSKGLTDKQKMWIAACKNVGSISVPEKLKRLRNFYDAAGKDRLFPELSPVSENWQVLNTSERDKYLPHLKQSPVISSVHGKSEGAETFTLTIGEGKCVQGKGFCYAGGPIWAMEWCPRPVACSQEQMLAIALDKEPGHHLYVNTVVECSNLLQFWSVRRENESKEISPRLDFCIAHDSGYVRSLSWCPMGCFDEIDSEEKDSSSSQEKVPSTLPRLGLLAAACSNATILIFSIPHPSSLDSLIQTTSDHHKPIIVKPKPCLKLIPNSRSDSTPCLSVSWQNGDGCERIIGGYGRGEVLMWHLASSSAFAQEDIKTLRPIRAFIRHKIGVVTCAWCPSLPHLFVSCDYSGLIYVWNSNRPLEPESVLKKTNTVITKAISMAGPVHWGFFTANDKLCIPDTFSRTSDMYAVNFHGLSPQCCVTADFNVAVVFHSVCTWDVTFNPVFNTLVICDTVGNVRVALPNEASLLTCNIGKSYTFASQTIQTLLYKLSLTPGDKGAKKKISPVTTGGKKEETVQQSDQVESELTRTNSCKESSEGESSAPVNDKDALSKDDTDENTGTGSLSVTTEMDPKSPSQNEKVSDDVMCYKMGDSHFKKPLKKHKKSSTLKLDSSEREDFGRSRGTNMESIQRVRLCPGMDTNLWLASGGNAGVLRFDRLYNLVTPYVNRIKQEVLKLNTEKSTKTTDS